MCPAWVGVREPAGTFPRSWGAWAVGSRLILGPGKKVLGSGEPLPQPQVDVSSGGRGSPASRESQALVTTLRGD